MKIVILDRATNAYLAGDRRWVRGLEGARAFPTSLDALRYCVETNLTKMDLLVCYPGNRSSLRLPLC
jgi:hypothetical protein